MATSLKQPTTTSTKDISATATAGKEALQKSITDATAQLMPFARNIILILKLISIGLIGMADLSILQLLLLIGGSPNILAALLFAQLYMGLFFVIPSIIIFGINVGV